MKIAITATGASLDAPVATKFGRAPYFIVVDTDTGAHTVHDNSSNIASEQGAGIRAVELMCSLGVDAVITGQCGPKALQALRTAGIRVIIGASGTARNALDKFKRSVAKSQKEPDAASDSSQVGSL